MVEDKLRNEARELLDSYIASHSMRRTPERYAILETVLSSTGHFTVDSLWETMQQSPYNVSRATVYGCVKLLSDIGVIRSLNFGTRLTYYEKAQARTSGHHHLICTQCGRVKDVRDPALMSTLNSRRYTSFHPAYTSIYVYGLCSRCSRRNKKSPLPQ